MELKYIVLTIIKIVVSVPGIFVLVESAALVGGHIDNSNPSSISKEEGVYISASASSSPYNENEQKASDSSRAPEEIPNPSPLVIPGYNLPENIFNRGKPFYLEKDPVTGKINFNSTPPPLSQLDDEEFYDYADEAEESEAVNDQGIFAKENIDRKDGNFGDNRHHRPTDINQLSPNFHDFLNLPIKYNPDKYVYPLISNSYANTKVQGNVNNNVKLHNHKNTVTKFPLGATYSPSVIKNSPTLSTTIRTSPTTTTRAAPSTTSTRPPTSTTRKSSFSEDFSDYEYENNKDYLSHENKNQGGTTSTSTQKIMSLFEQLFGDYSDPVTEVATTSTTTKPIASTTSRATTTASTTTTTTEQPRTTSSTTSKPTTTITEEYFYEYEDEAAVYNSHSYKDTTTTTTERPTSPTTSSTTRATTTTESIKVTSLQLGEHHVFVTPKVQVAPQPHPIYETYNNNYRPIIIATQNLRNQLNNERVQPKPFQKLPPSSSKIHIAPDQDTVSFVMGQQQDFSTNSFQPLYESEESSNYNVFPERNLVTIQTPNSDSASLSIGVPIITADTDTKKIPGQVMDAELEHVHTQKISFPKDVKISVAPPIASPISPLEISKLSTSQQLQNQREILKLASKPMFHQLPSDLTPPREAEQVQLRPPWDPRPGHFFSGKLEYSRPPKPVAFPDMTYKRIDVNLPNILPQFRPNTNGVNVNNNNRNYLYPSHHTQKQHQQQQPHRKIMVQHHREALLERPLSNRPLEFYEKLQPPPLPPQLPHFRKSEVPTHGRVNVNANAQDRKDDNGNNMNHLVLKPPKAPISSLKHSGHVETLQMLQAKKEMIEDNASQSKSDILDGESSVQEASTEKTVYVVYPVNASPIKLDVIDNPNKKESVVIGSRAELPLPPSEIKSTSSSDEMPILKPQSRPVVLGSKSEFPYALERPDISILHPVPDASHNSINSDIRHTHNENVNSVATIVSNNQWSIVDIEGGANKMFTEKPIAVAYTPTEPNFSNHNHQHRIENDENLNNNHRIDDGNNNNNLRTEQDFQAPFQASVKVDSPSQGWSIIRRKSYEKSDETSETTTISSNGPNDRSGNSDFDIENFKPQLEGGFKPIYTFPSVSKNEEVERE